MTIIFLNFRNTTYIIKISNSSGTDILLIILFLAIIAVDLAVEILEFVLDPYTPGKILTGIFFGIQFVAPLISLMTTSAEYLTLGCTLLFTGIDADIAFNMILINVPILTQAQYIFLWFSIPVFIAQICWAARQFWLYNVYKTVQQIDREENQSLIK